MELPAAEFSIALLGPFQAELEGMPLQGFRTAKVRALLAYLAVESHRPWSRSTLADLLWSEMPERDAQSNLRNAISNLRQVIGDRHRDSPFLLVSQDTLQFNQNTATWLDVKAFTDLVTTVTDTGGGALDQEDIARLEQALALYRGSFMEGFFINSAPFEEWVLMKSQGFHQKMIGVLHLLVVGFQASGELERALNHARRWVDLEPWDEAAHRALMLIYMRKGQRNAALGQYETCRQRIELDLGVEPEPATTRLYKQLRNGQAEVGLGSISPGHLPVFLKGAQPPQSERLTFVARKKELQRLEDDLENAIQGKGRLLFVTGDPGSGKTALLAEFARRAMIKVPELIVAGGQCNAYTGAADPYYPFLEIIRTLSGDVEGRVLGGAIKPEHAMRLWHFLPEVVSTLLEHGPDLINRFLCSSDLINAAQASHTVTPELLIRLQTQVERSGQQPPRLQQVTLLSQFARVLSSLSQNSPLLLILDDLQWIDTDSVNLLFHMGRRLAGARILLLGAYRPEDVAPGLQGVRHPLEGVVNELQTNLGDIHIDLMQSEGSDFVEALLDSEPNQLSADFRRILCQHTGGHPLFTIELLRGMQLRGDIYRNMRGKWVEGQQLNWDKLPVRVESVIAERIGHLPREYQDMLSVACVEGEGFTAEILAGILNKNAPEVIRILSQEIGKRQCLVVAQSRKQVRGQTLSQYRFRHFLFQKYLYQQLDDVEKARLHEKTGAALERFYAQDFIKYPEIAHQLARHFELAGLLEKAVQYYAESGRYAIQLSANREAITHFERALRLAKALPGSEQRDWLALNLHLSLGPPLTATRGWGAPELEANYQQAEEFCNKIADDPRLMPALWLLSVYRLGRSEHVTVDRLVERFSRLAKKSGDPGMLCLADLQVSPLYQGKLAAARQILTRASLSHDLELQRSLAYQYGMSPSVVGMAYLGNCLWLLGYPEQAKQCIREACDFAEEINVPMTTCYAVSRMCWQNAFAGETETMRLQAEKLLQITRQHEFRNFELAALFFLHWLNAQAGVPADEEIVKMHQAMQAYQGLGTLLNRTTFLILFAQACGRAGQIERGLAALDESITFGQKTGERWFEAESYRLKGKLLVQQASNSPQPEVHLDEAKTCFRAAQWVARQQGAEMLELRANESLYHNGMKSDS